MTKHNDWKQFCERAAAVMRDALSKRISLEDASGFFEKEKAISDPQILP
jgi:hypothetical protein